MSPAVGDSRPPAEICLLPLIATVVPAAVVEPAPLTPSQDAYASLSPDGKTLLFQSNRTGRWALYMADADGKNLRAFLDSGDDPSVPVWSPDGRRIAFVASVDGQTEIFMIDAGGGNRQRLSNQPGDDSHPHWSADGRRLFFNSFNSAHHARSERRLGKAVAQRVSAPKYVC